MQHRPPQGPVAARKHLADTDIRDESVLQSAIAESAASVALVPQRAAAAAAAAVLSNAVDSSIIVAGQQLASEVFERGSEGQEEEGVEGREGEEEDCQPEVGPAHPRRCLVPHYKGLWRAEEALKLLLLHRSEARDEMDADGMGGRRYC